MGKVADRVSRGEIKRVIINLPYRHLKSETWSRDFPSFFAGNHPDKKIATISHVHRLARGFGRDVRNTFGTKAFHRLWPDISLTGDSFASDLFHIQKKKPGRDEFEPIQGIYLATSITGSIMGEGVDLGIIDDPHKDFLKAQNRSYTDETWDYFTQVLFNRLQPDAVLVGVGQRLSEHDIWARLIEHGKSIGKPWEVIQLPAVSDENGNAIIYNDIDDIAKLRKGRPLWDHFGIDYWIDQALTMGPTAFMAMAQQQPIPFSGQIIKEPWIRHWAHPNNCPPGRIALPDSWDSVIQSWDLAFKGTAAGSYVVGQVWGQAGPFRYLLDQVRGQWGFEESCKAIISLRSKWPQARKIIIEDKANGPAAESSLHRKIAGIELVPPGTMDKAARMRATEPEWASHHVLLPPPETHSWVKGYIQRLMQFPTEPNDEGDATSQALNYMCSRFNALKALTEEGDGPDD